jgi:hypothetical protein
MKTKMYTFATKSCGSARRNVGIAVAIAMSVLLSGCIVPDEFDLKFDIPNSSEVSWTYDGKWQYYRFPVFSGKFDKRLTKLNKKEFIEATKTFDKLPGNISATHIEKNIWKQSISWKTNLRDAHGRPWLVTFPMEGTVAEQNILAWLVRIIPVGDKSVLLSTVPVGKDKKIKELFHKMGFKSSGALTIKTTGTVEQLSGPELSKARDSNSYYSKWELLEDEPIKIRITW